MTHAGTCLGGLPSASVSLLGPAHREAHPPGLEPRGPPGHGPQLSLRPREEDWARSPCSRQKMRPRGDPRPPQLQDPPRGGPSPGVGCAVGPEVYPGRPGERLDVLVLLPHPGISRKIRGGRCQARPRASLGAQVEGGSLAGAGSGQPASWGRPSCNEASQTSVCSAETSSLDTLHPVSRGWPPHLSHLTPPPPPNRHMTRPPVGLPLPLSHRDSETTK